MPQVETPYGSIYYADHQRHAERSTPIVLIHGAASSHLAWSRELRRLVGWRVLTPDLPGHGRSSGEAVADVEVYAAALKMWLARLGVERAVIVGHSMGGAIAQTLALSVPQQVAGLVLIATGAKLGVNQTILQGVLEDKHHIAELLNEWSWSSAAPQALRQADLGALLQAPAEQIYADYSACNQFDVTDRLGEISVPTLIICGTADKMTPLTLSGFLAAHIPKATLKTVEGAGHWVTLEQPQSVAGLVTDWLAISIPQNPPNQ